MHCHIYIDGCPNPQVREASHERKSHPENRGIRADGNPELSPLPGGWLFPQQVEASEKATKKKEISIMNKDYTELTGANILIVDDQPANRDLLIKALEPEGCRIISAPSGEVALKIAPRTVPELILLDILMPGLDGFEVCQQLKAEPSTQNIPIIFVTAKGETKDVIEGFRIGGVDYITKPFEREEVLARVQTHLRVSRLTKELTRKNEELAEKNKELAQEINNRKKAEEAQKNADEELSLISHIEAEQWGITGFVGKSKTITEILEKVRQLQTVGTMSILITGESGTGKELIARAIHFGGKRAKGRFVPLNCSVIPAELAEATLFGHVRGAFTGANQSRKGYFERADGGTLFLDEIGDMPFELQTKLLRVLDDGTFTPVGGEEEKHIDVGIIAATNANLLAQIKAGKFREDLYFRLARCTVSVPPLRERKEDIPLLANHFLKMFAAEMGRESVLSPKALDALMDYHFPGNVRELKNIIEHALILSGDGIIQPEHLNLINLNMRPIPSTMGDGISHLPQTPDPGFSLATAATQKITDEEKVLAYIRQHGHIDNTTCRALLQCEFNRASYLLRKMDKEGSLVRVGSHRWSRYQLPE